MRLCSIDTAANHERVAYDQGRTAFLDGYADDVNPYRRGTLSHEEWLEGWDHEHSAHLDEVVSDARDAYLDDPRRRCL